MIRLALFDCDGTLADGLADIRSAMRAAFADEGLPPPPPDTIRAIIGLSLETAMKALLPDAPNSLHHHLAARYRTRFRQDRAAGRILDPLFPGIEEALNRIEAAGWRLGIATGRSRRSVEALIAREGWQGRFVTLQTADTHPSKPHPAMLLAAATDAGADHVAMIGDTGYDMAMAGAARIPPVSTQPMRVTAIGVLWGYHEGSALVDAGADHLVAHPEDLPPLLAGLTGRA